MLKLILERTYLYISDYTITDWSKISRSIWFWYKYFLNRNKLQAGSILVYMYRIPLPYPVCNALSLVRESKADSILDAEWYSTSINLAILGVHLSFR